MERVLCLPFDERAVDEMISSESSLPSFHLISSHLHLGSTKMVSFISTSKCLRNFT